MQHQHNNKFNYATVCDFDTYQHRNQFQTLITESNEEEDPLPTFEEFQGTINDYLSNLSPKKRDKALVDHARYCLIQEVLKNPRNTLISTAQFRFWVKKMFQLQPGSYDLVCHDNKPVAMKEQIYDILVNAHKEAHHGGRDKTSAIVRNQFSWIPKELVARFVRQCPTCISRRNGSQSMSAYTSKTSSPRIDFTPTMTGSFCYDAVSMAAAAASAATSIHASTPSLLYTPSSKADSEISTSPSTDMTYKASPNSYTTSSPSPPKRPFYGQDGLFSTSEAAYKESTHLQQKMKLSADNNQLPYSFRRPEYSHYTAFTEPQPSFYNTLIHSYPPTNMNIHDNDKTTNNNNAYDTSIKLERNYPMAQPSAHHRPDILSHHATTAFSSQQQQL